MPAKPQPQDARPARTGGADAQPQYRRIAADITNMIGKGLFGPGARLPSLRDAATRFGVSVPTVLQAYIELESRGLLLARPRSGFFVATGPGSPRPAAAPGGKARPTQAPCPQQLSGTIRWLRDAATPRGRVPLGMNGPSMSLYPISKLHHLATNMCRRTGLSMFGAADLRGDARLRTAIAERLLSRNFCAEADEVVVTTGATEAISLCLQLLARPGDAVAIESPGYYGSLLALQQLHLKPVEIPACPHKGMDVDRLADALGRQRIAAVIVVANFANPSGARMPDADKARLVALCERHGVPLIEDDSNGELFHGAHRPLRLKSLDTGGNVYLCSSFSKTLSPSLRVGYVVPGRGHEALLDIKFCTTGEAPALPQAAVAEFLQASSFERHLRRLRTAFAVQTAQLADAVERDFPTGTQVHRPSGGCFVWVGLPPGVGAQALHQAAHADGIDIVPGTAFSASGGFADHIRLNGGRIWDEQMASGVRRLGTLVARLAEGPAR